MIPMATRASATFPGAAGKHRRKIAAFRRAPGAMASLATACCIVLTPANAWADDLRATAPVPAELTQWHSGLTVGGEPGAKPEWQSSLSAIGSEDSSAYLMMHGAAGPRNATQERIDSVDPAGSAGRTRRIAR